MARHFIEFILFVWMSWYIVLTISDENTVNILPSSPLDSLNNDHIIHVLTNNNESATDNFTSELLMEELKSTVDEFSTPPVTLEDEESNPYYEKYSDTIDVEIQHLLRVAPDFNANVANVNPKCKKHSKIFQRELRKMTLWALRMYDATAKMPSGLLNGNVNQFGDFDECVKVKGSDGIRGKYCLAFLQVEVDQSRPDLKFLHRLLHSHYQLKNNYTDMGHRIPRFGTTHWAVCVPEMCTAADVQIALRQSLEKHLNGTGFNVHIKVEPRMCEVLNTGPWPRGTIIVGCLFIGIIVLSILAAICDHNNVNVSKIILAFSLKTNYRKLMSLNRSPDDIPSVHGIRALNAFMLIVGHKCMALLFIPFMNRTEMSEIVSQPWTFVARAASLYTDPFVMLSGLLTSYTMIKQLNNGNKIDLKKEYITRFFRLVPTLMALILFCAYIMPVLGSGPMWNLIITHHAENCKRRWWRNLLFIQNYFGFENICLTHTHHISLDTQLFLVAPMLIWLLYKWPKYGSITLGALAMISTGLRFFVAYYRQLNTYIHFGVSTQQLFDTANFSYSLPTHRLTIYIMGIFLGYLLRKYPKEYKMNEFAVKLIWILVSLISFLAFIGPSYMSDIDYVYAPLHGAIYNAFAPIGWCAIFAWIIVTSHTWGANAWISKVLAWRGFIVCTRLSYGIYLTQFPLYFYNVGRTRTANHFSVYDLISIPETIIIVISAAILTLLIELPFQNIKNILLVKSDEKMSVTNIADKTK